MDMKISPSMLACDFANMGAEANKCAAGGAHLLHLDVMDGHFVPNISFGAPVIAGLSKVCDLPFDVHLMISQPLRYIDDYADAGADLQNDVAVIVRVARQQQHTQLLLELRAVGTAEIDLLARDLVQLGVAQQRLRLRDLRLTGGIRPVGLHDRLQLELRGARALPAQAGPGRAEVQANVDPDLDDAEIAESDPALRRGLERLRDGG